MRSWATVSALSVVAACQPAEPASAPSGTCLSSEVAPGPVLVRVGEVDLTVPHLLAGLRSRGAVELEKTDEAAVRRYVDEEARFALLVRAARDAGLASDPEVVLAAQRIMVRKLLQRDLKSEVPEPDPAALSAYYERHKDEYQQPEKRRFSEIELAHTDDGKRLAEQLLTELRAAPDMRATFRLLAAKHSRNSVSRSRGGEHLHMDEVAMRQSFGDAFAAKLFAATPGSLLDGPVESSRGWHVVQVIAKRDALFRGLDEVRDDIAHKLIRDKRSQRFDAYVEGLRQKYGVTIFEPRLTDLVAAVEAARNPDDEARPRPTAPQPPAASGAEPSSGKGVE